MLIDFLSDNGASFKTLQTTSFPSTLKTSKETLPSSAKIIIPGLLTYKAKSGYVKPTLVSSPI